MKLELILEAFRQKYYQILKIVGNIVVLKLSEPLKVNHIGKIHTTNIICYNTQTNRFSGGMEEKGDVKIPSDFAFVFQPERVKESKKQGIDMFVEWLNSKGYFSQHQIKTGTAQFIPKLDMKERPETKRSKDQFEKNNNKFKKYKDFPNESLQKKLILNYANKSTEEKLFVFTFETKGEAKKDKTGRIVNETYYEDHSGFYPVYTLDSAVSWLLDSPKFQEIAPKISAKMVDKKVIGNSVYIWTADSIGGLFCGGLFKISGNRVTKIVTSEEYKEWNGQQADINYVSLSGGKLDMNNSEEEKVPVEQRPIKIHKDIVKLEPDSDEEIQAFLTKRDQEKKEQAERDAALKASLATSSLKQNEPDKPKEKVRRKLEID